MGRTGLAALAVTVLLAGCGAAGDGNDDGSEGAPGRSPAKHAVPSSPAPAAEQPTVDAAAPGFPPTRSAVVVHRRAFSSPTGNIACQVRRGGATCVITEHDYPVAERPDGCAGRWLPRLDVDTAHRARLGSCEGGVLEPGAALPYGTTTVVGEMRCLSRESGMTCWSGRSGHGFTLARAAYRLH